MPRASSTDDEIADQAENLAEEAADVQNVRALFGLGVSVRLDVDTNELRGRITALELVPFC